MIGLRNVALGYGGNVVIEDINLNLTAGDFLVIGLTKTDELAILFARKNSGREAQLRLLFDLPGREKTGFT